ncbi:hypothetical protein HCC13_09580 [Streptococcus suis]|nr:hypothetical protein [Streptococcus suis]
MIDEASKKKLAKTYRIFCLLCLMWIPYFWFLHYWITHDWTIPLQVFAMCFIVTAVFQPLFWYIMLGIFLCVFTNVFFDEINVLKGKKSRIIKRSKEVLVQQEPQSPKNQRVQFLYCYFTGHFLNKREWLMISF